MPEYTYHVATDRRVYNGAESGDMLKERKSIEALKAALPDNALWTYFPLEGKWDCSLKDFRGEMFYQLSWETDLGDCLVAALNKIDEMGMSNEN
jgi:hypothetical protein